MQIGTGLVNERCDSATPDTILTTGEIAFVGLAEAALEEYPARVSRSLVIRWGPNIVGIQSSMHRNRQSVIWQRNADKTRGDSSPRPTRR